MKAMISQPMANNAEKEITDVRNHAIHVLENLGCEIVNTLFSNEWTSDNNINIINKPLYFLAHSLESMSTCDTVYFCKGWENARGCRIEHDAAVAYGLSIIEEVDDKE